METSQFVQATVGDKAERGEAVTVYRRRAVVCLTLAILPVAGCDRGDGDTVPASVNVDHGAEALDLCDRARFPGDLNGRPGWSFLPEHAGIALSRVARLLDYSLSVYGHETVDIRFCDDQEAIVQQDSVAYYMNKDTWFGWIEGVELRATRGSASAARSAPWPGFEHEDGLGQLDRNSWTVEFVDRTSVRCTHNRSIDSVSW